MKKRYAIPLVAASALACTGAMGQDMAPFKPSWYAGLGGGRTHMKDRDLTLAISGGFVGVGQTTTGGKDIMGTGRVGYRFHRYLAVEANYWDLGRYTFDESVPPVPPDPSGPATAIQGTTRAKSYGASLVGILPSGPVDFYARAGYARTELKSHASGNGVDFSATTHENGFAGGVGARWNFAADAYHPAMSVFLEYQRHNSADIDSVILGAELRF